MSTKIRGQKQQSLTAGNNRSLNMAISLALSLFITFVIFSLLLLFTGTGTVTALKTIVEGAFGNKFAVGMTLVKATPLLFAGLAVALPYRSGLFNIGAEGQLYIGAVATAVIALYLGTLPALLMLPLAMVTGFFAGAIWGGIPGFLKARYGWHEIIITLMMNYIAILLVNYLVEGPLSAPEPPFPMSPEFAKSSFLPFIITGTRLHLGFVIAVAAAALVYFLLQRTTFGFQLKVVGRNPIFAKNQGLSVPKFMFLSMLLGGGLAGWAGSTEIMGVHHRLLEGFSPGYGYQAIAVAFLGQNNPLGIIVASLFAGALNTGGNFLQRTQGVPGALIFVVQAMPVMFLAVFERTRLNWTSLSRLLQRGKNKAGGKANVSNTSLS